MPTLPVSRVAVSVEITRGALVEGDDLVARWGSWELDAQEFDPAPPQSSPPDVLVLPTDLRELLDPDTEVTLGWQSQSHPMAIPARWREGVAEIGRAVMALAGSEARGPASMTSERSGESLRDKQGVLVSGDGRAHLSGDTVAVAFDWKRISWWVGDESRSVDIKATQQC